MSEEELQVQQQKSKKGLCCFLGGCCGCGCVLPLVILLIMLFTVFSCDKVDYEIPAIDVNDTMTQSIIITQAYSQILQAESKDETAEITVTPAQLESLTKVFHNTMAVYMQEERLRGKPLPINENDFQIVYNDGAFDVKFQYEIPESPVAAVFNASARLAPFMTPTTEGVKILKLYGIYTPYMKINFTIDEDEYNLFRQGIRSLEINQEGELKIIYYPWYFKDYLDDIKDKM